MRKDMHGLQCHAKHVHSNHPRVQSLGTCLATSALVLPPCGAGNENLQRPAELPISMAAVPKQYTCRMCRVPL